MARHYTDKNGKIRTESSMSRGASGELSSDLLSCCLLRGAERDTSCNNYHQLVMFLHTSGRWSGGKWMSPHYFLIRTTLLHPSHCSRSRPAGDRGNARGRVGVWEQCSGGGAAGRIVAVSALSPEHQQDAAADYVARRLRQITPTWGHSDDGNMLTNSSLLAHVN